VKSRCLWLEDAPFHPGESTPLPSHSDVTIIGGGYTGISAARALARAGATAVVLDRERPGWGASTRNGGFLLPGYKREPSWLAARYGLERARRLLAESLESLTHLEALIREAAIDCDYRRSGHLTLAESRRQMEELAREQRVLRRTFDYGTILLGPGEIAGEVGASGYRGGLLDERAGSVQPARLFHGLARSAVGLGAILVSGTGALAIKREQGGFRVETDRGGIRSTHVVVATNGYSGPVHPEFQRRLVPIGSHIIATAPIGRELASRLIPRDRVLSDSRNLLHYFRLSPDHRLIFGGRATFRPSGGDTDRNAARILQQDMVRTFPQLGEIAVAYAWSGNVAFTRDQMPHAAWLDGVLCAGGYCGHGVAMAIYLGDRIGQHLAAGTDLPFLAALDFPAIPLYHGRPWFLPLAGGWYRLRDWMGL
jgi:glycine/D-amino acid oxidase-like deaminating enzyme